MEDSKKIITRAVFGHINQTFRNTVNIAINEEDKDIDILGCKISGAKVLRSSIEGYDGKSKKVKVDLSFGIHVWYKSKDDTRISKVNAVLTDIIDIEKQGTEDFSHEDVYVWIRGTPKCIGKPVVIEAEENMVAVQIEYMLEAEVIGQTVINVKVFE
ncbi:MAG: outer spore coat protein CotE [Burkholderiales bacterium]